MDKLSWNTIADKFITSFKGIDSFRIKNKNNPLLFSYKQKDFYVFFRNISHGGGDYPEGTTRVQLPEKTEFDLVKKSNIPFFLMGYDQNDDVFVCWEPQKVKKRLNEKGYVSFFARKNVQNITSNRYIVFSTLSNGDFFVAVKTADIPKFFDLTDFFPPKEPFNKETEEKRLLPSKFTPTQTIYYGVPGCGKSHEIKKKLKNVPDYNKIRTVFHPEYCNADFVGQILPEVNINADGRSIVEYKFKPGPFTEIVRRAYLNPDENFYLVIEEINRGNAAAIFGEMFQLLDRLDADENADEVSSEHIYGKGWSSYGVDNQDVNAYIRNQVVISQEKPEHCSNVTGSAGDLNPRLYKSMDIESENVTVTWREKNENGFTPKSKHIHFTANTAIRLPPNLSIYATMNTSDQNVFTLDNAFQRRWEMKQIPNDLKNTGDSAAQYHRTIKKVKKTESREETIDTNVQWGDFRKAINEVIMDSAQANGLSSMEDKRLGGWFYTESDNFAEKVLKYLWDDAFKFDRPNQFNDVTTLEELVEKFNGDDGFNVFKDGRISELQKDSLTTPDTPAQNDTSVTNG